MSTTGLIAAVALVAAAAGWLAFRRRLWLWAAGLDTLALVAGYVLVTTGGLIVWAAAAVLGGLAGLVGWHRWGRSSAIVGRWGRRSRRTSGVATTLDVLRVASAWAMRRRARIVRPSFAGLSWRELRRVPVTEYAVRLLRAGWVEVWASVEDVVAIFGGPRTGKTGLLAAMIVDAPGAAVVTSTRLDLMELTRILRGQRGPVYVFNPGGLGGESEAGEPLLPSTLGFDPLTGCANPVTATERAIDMVPETRGGSGDRAYWDGQARRVLAAYLHAAALGGRTMHDVLRWVSDPAGTHREVRTLLEDSPQPAFVQDANQFVTTNERTRSSITSTVMPALQWLLSPAADAAARPIAGQRFDVVELIRSRGTVYLLGRDEAYTAPLMAALVGYICREARRYASTMPGGRIDPTLGLYLDEAGRAAPVPLDDWTGDAGGSGICIVAAFQSRADVLDRWGTTGGAKIVNNAGAVVLFGGTKDPDDLQMWVDLAGERDEDVVTRGKDRRVTSRTTRTTRVLPAARLSNLPAGRAVLYRRGLPPVIGRPRMAWDRPDVQAAADEARRERTFDRAWQATAIANAGAEVVAAAERLAYANERTQAAARAEQSDQTSGS